MIEKLKVLIDTNPQYTIPGLCITIGAVAHLAEEVRKGKWRGWINAIADMIVCGFAGFIFYQIAQLTTPQYTYLYCSIGSFYGTKGFRYIFDWMIESLEVSINKYNGTK